MEKIKLNLIDVDTEQPRKLFDVNRLRELKDSVKTHGIITPLIVEKLNNGRFMLVDGERRYKVATELKVSTVPVVVINPETPVQRLIQQYHIQEQHEGWSSTEKAMAILKLSDETGMTIAQISESLGIPRSTTETYVSFGKMFNKNVFVKRNLAIGWVPRIQGLKDQAKKLTEEVLEKSFNTNDSKNLELAVIQRISRGDFTKPSQLTKIKDSFSKDPKSIKKFMENEELTAVDIFRETGARVTYHLRNVRNNAVYLSSHGREFLKTKDAKIDEKLLNQLKNAKKICEELIALAE